MEPDAKPAPGAVPTAAGPETVPAAPGGAAASSSAAPGGAAAAPSAEDTRPAASPQSPPRIAPGLPRVGQSRSVVGHLDGIDHGHEVSGWVFDAAQPARRCTVELRVDGAPVATLEAGLPRPDLRAFRLRPDCGFRFSVPAAALDGVIHRIEAWLQPEGLRIGAPRRLACVISDHGTYPKTASVDSILRLQDGDIDLDRVFTDAFLQKHGVRAAVAYGYLWLLKRPPDASGWERYSARLLAGELGLGQFLAELGASEEAARARRSGLDLLAEFQTVLAAAARLPVTGEEPGGGGR